MSIAVATLVVGEILFYTGQGFFAKLFSLTHPARASDATPGFNMIYGLLVALGTWIFTGFRLKPDTLTLVIGSVNGIALFFYNYSAIHAAQSGPYTLQSLMSGFGNILIPMAIFVFLWGDRLNAIQLTGIGLMLGAFVLFNSEGLKRLKIRQNGFFWFLMVFVMNGVYSALNDVQQRMEAGAHRQDMIIISFLTAGLFSIAYLLLPRNTDARIALRMPSRAYLYAFLSSICAAAAINTLMAALRYVPSSLLYPMGSGSLLITGAVLSRLVLHEKLSRIQVLGITIAVIGVVLTNISLADGNAIHALSGIEQPHIRMIKEYRNIMNGSLEMESFDQELYRNAFNSLKNVGYSDKDALAIAYFSAVELDAVSKDVGATFESNYSDG